MGSRPHWIRSLGSPRWFRPISLHLVHPNSLINFLDLTRLSHSTQTAPQKRRGLDRLTIWNCGRLAAFAEHGSDTQLSTFPMESQSRHLVNPHQWRTISRLHGRHMVQDNMAISIQNLVVTLPGSDLEVCSVYIYADCLTRQLVLFLGT
jgi:hypothetical protein